MNEREREHVRSMAVQVGASETKRPRGADQKGLGERSGRVNRDEPAVHPVTKETGTKGESNVGQDETSGDG